MQGQGHRLEPVRGHPGELILQHIDLASRVGDLQLAVEIHLQVVRGPRVELQGLVDRHHIEPLHRRIRRADRFGRFRHLAATGQGLQVLHLLIQDAQDAPAAFRKVRHPAIVVQIIPRHPLRAAGDRDQIVALGNAHVVGVSQVGVLRVPLGPECVPRDVPGVRFIHHHVQQPEDHRVPEVGAQQGRGGIFLMRPSGKDQRGIRIVLHALGDRFGPEEKPSAGSVGATVEHWHRHPVQIVGHLEGERLSGVDRRLERLARRIALRHYLRGKRNGIVQVDHHLPEASVHAVADRLGAADIGDRSAANLLAGLRVMISRSDRFHNEAADRPVRPGRASQGMVVPEDRAQVGIHPVTIPDELYRDDLPLLVAMFQGLREMHRVAFDGLDPPHLGGLHLIHPDHDVGLFMKRRGPFPHLEFDLGGAGLDIVRQDRIHRGREALLFLFTQHGKGAHRLLVGKTGDHPVGGLVVELDEVGMDIDLRHLEIRGVVIHPLALQDHVHAVVDVGPVDQRPGQVGIRPDGRLLLMQNVNRPVRVDHSLLLSDGLIHRDRSFDKVNGVLLSSSVLGAEAPPPLLARPCGQGCLLFGSPDAARIGWQRPGVLGHMNRLQPGGRAVVPGKWYPLSEVWLEMRPGQLARLRLKQDGRAPARHGGFIFRKGELLSHLRLAERPIALPAPVPHRGVVGQDLALLIRSVTRLSGRRQHQLDPFLDRDLRNRLRPVGLLLRDIPFLVIPIHRLADQFVGGDRPGDSALAVRQFLEGRHGIGADRRIIPGLQRVVDPPVGPHARDVMMRDVAVEQEITRQLLAEPRSALGLQIQRLCGTDHLDIHAVRGGPDHRVFDRAVGGGRQQFLALAVRFGLPQPADRPAVRMVGMEDLPASVHQPVFGGIPHVGPGNRRRHVTEGIGAVGHRFIFKMKVLFLKREVVDPERLASVIQGARRRTVGVRVRVALRDHLPLAVQGSEGLIPDLVIENDELPEIGGVGVCDHHLPAALGFFAGQRIEIDRAGRLHDKRADHPQAALLPAHMAVEHPGAFLLGSGDEPLEDLGLPRRNVRVGIDRRGRHPGGLDDGAGAVNMQADILVLHPVSQGDLHAIPLIGPEHKRLNIIGLKADRYRSRIKR